MKGNILTYLGILLLLIALILGGVIIYQRQQTNNQNQLQTQPQTTEQGSTQPVSLSQPPAQDAPEKERYEFYNKLVQEAKDATRLDITGCKPNPVVMRIKNKANFQIVNNDAVEHTIMIDEKHTYKVGAKSTQTIQADFGREVGGYSYTCDQLNNPKPPMAGYFVVVP